MKLLRWSYYRRNHVKALFDKHPSSPVMLRKVTNYYFTYFVDWSAKDPVVTGKDLKQMELLLNQALGCEPGYLNRKAVHKRKQF